MRILSREELDKIRERIIETQGSVTLTDWSEQLLSDRWDLFYKCDCGAVLKPK